MANGRQLIEGHQLPGIGERGFAYFIARQHFSNFYNPLLSFQFLNARVSAPVFGFLIYVKVRFAGPGYLRQMGNTNKLVVAR